MTDLLTPARRPDPRRLDPALYPARKTVAFRANDVDQFGHVNNIAMQELHQEARSGLFDRLWPPVDGRRPLTTIAVQHVTHFLDEAFYPGSVECHAGIGQVGAKSFTVATLVTSDDGRPLTVADTVFVVRLDGDVLAITDEHRTLLTGYALRV